MHTIIVNNCERGDTVVKLTRAERKLIEHLLYEARQVSIRVCDTGGANAVLALINKISDEKFSQEEDADLTI